MMLGKVIAFSCRGLEANTPMTIDGDEACEFETETMDCSAARDRCRRTVITPLSRRRRAAVVTPSSRSPPSRRRRAHTHNVAQLVQRHSKWGGQREEAHGKPTNQSSQRPGDVSLIRAAVLLCAVNTFRCQ